VFKVSFIAKLNKMTAEIIGRKKEIQVMQNLKESAKLEF
jgi:hypothetical protein